jgi:hypothetical protein
MLARESIEKDCEKHLNTTESAEYTENNCSPLRSLRSLWLITYANIPFSRRNKKVSKTLTLIINKHSAINLRLSAFICGLIKSLKTRQPYYIFNILISNDFQEVIEI